MVLGAMRPTAQKEEVTERNQRTLPAEGRAKLGPNPQAAAGGTEGGDGANAGLGRLFRAGRQQGQHTVEVRCTGGHRTGGRMPSAWALATACVRLCTPSFP